MMIQKNGKKCRNIQEQVGKNTEDIEILKKRYPSIDFVMNASIDDDELQKNENGKHLTIKQFVDGVEQTLHFKGGKDIKAGANISIYETEHEITITATTEPVGSVDFANIGGNPYDNVALKNSLDNKFTLIFGRPNGNETDGWLRIKNQSGLQIQNILDEQMIWISDGTLRYYPNKTQTQIYTDLEFGNHSGTIAVTSDIPTKTSDLTNDSGFITADDVPTKVSELENDSGFITSVSWSEIIDKPTFAIVATSGDYNDLINKPTIPTQFIKQQSASGNTLTWIDESGTSHSWTPQSGEGGITDVTVNGDSVVEDGVAKIVIPADAQFVYDLTLDPTTGAVTINNDNYYTRIKNYIDENDKYPIIYGVVHIANQPDLVILVKDITLDTDTILINGYATSFGGNFTTNNVIEITATETTQIAVYEQTKIVNDKAPRITDVEVTNNNILFKNANGHNVEYTPTIPTKTSDLTNDSGFITESDIPAQQQADWNQDDNTQPDFIKNKPNVLTVPESHTEETLVGVDTTGAQEQVKIGNGLVIEDKTLTTKHLYKHSVYFRIGTKEDTTFIYFTIQFYDHDATPYSSTDARGIQNYVTNGLFRNSSIFGIITDVTIGKNVGPSYVGILEYIDITTKTIHNFNLPSGFSSVVDEVIEIE